MRSITIRNLPEPVHRALRVRAASHDRSMEAELREILTTAVFPANQTPFGEELRANWSGVYGDEFADLRDKTAHEPPSL